MNRRNFIQQTAAASLLTAIGGLTLPSFTTKKKKQITILHTNDTHSHIEPFEQSHYKYANKGGIARRASAIQAIRKENPNTLLLDAGDIFQGTPYFNYFGGELEFKLMSMLKYDLATLGNHDFDNSIDGFYKQLPNAKFDFVSANYNFKNTILDDIVKPYKIFIKDGIKIGVFGLGVQLDGLVDPKMYKETKYLDPIEISQDMSRILKEDKQCDLIICLSHLGYFYKQHPTKISDLNLAQKTNNIDLIIGGHTHTFLPKPTIVKNIDDKNLLVNQVGAYGINLGRVDFYFDEYDNKSAKGTTILL
ncbi:bifunctional metallophosphatase/5'-nucleotidase [Tenacibaculum maritimum]|uniref:bifunctional metallophosphatase/5'-nucleotidase n=1 Tax=Tenacibaculum maritimum TaxID=107401 RepID=UPI001E6527D0|nr:metallophosphatase [Tenacibaculum maritimum]MCD9586228.1 metallophosphatase [Tenacibaculum maritimum]MCD9620955.1 metallophosphatase [Tenacibaculum maritimum]MCD9627035.1 metallophosphatase [Tenacibaculum maritimum]MCD9629656.1 metallophosphatase [Tenacibaculum maritimum]MCD9634117.1 metallophosphatase [Tenacibaculum maritimum]